MSRPGKIEQTSGGSLRPSQRKAEKAARRSTKRADRRTAFRNEDRAGH